MMKPEYNLKKCPMCYTAPSIEYAFLDVNAEARSWVMTHNCHTDPFRWVESNVELLFEDWEERVKKLEWLKDYIMQCHSSSPAWIADYAMQCRASYARALNKKRQIRSLKNNEQH